MFFLICFFINIRSKCFVVAKFCTPTQPKIEWVAPYVDLKFNQLVHLQFKGCSKLNWHFGQKSDVLDLVTIFHGSADTGLLIPHPHKSLIGLHPSNNERYPVAPVCTSVTSWLPYLSHANLTWKTLQAEDGPID